MNATTRTIAAIMGGSALLAACGDDSNSALVGLPVGTPASPRTIEISMVDIGYESVEVVARPGETIRFSFVNEGALRHEAIFGDGAVQDEHEAEMLAAGGSHDAMDMGDSMDMDDGSDMDHATDDDSAMSDAMDMDDDSDMDHATDDDAMDDDASMGDMMDMDHDAAGGPPALSLEPGETGEIVMTFDGAERDGTIIGCHITGHWAAGMRLDVTIESV